VEVKKEFLTVFTGLVLVAGMSGQAVASNYQPTLTTEQVASNDSDAALLNQLEDRVGTESVLPSHLRAQSL